MINFQVTENQEQAYAGRQSHAWLSCVYRMRKVVLTISNQEVLMIASPEFALTQSWLALVDYFFYFFLKLLAATQKESTFIFFQ